MRITHDVLGFFFLVYRTAVAHKRVEEFLKFRWEWKTDPPLVQYCSSFKHMASDLSQEWVSVVCVQTFPVKWVVTQVL